MTPKLSIFSITFNHAPFIRQALESILTQRVSFDYEIVVGDDCSTDGMRAILEEYQRRFPDRIKPIFRDKNVGMMRNVVETLNQCQGDYIACLEGDDYWTDPDKLQLQVDFMDQNPGCALCHHRVAHIASPGETVIREFPASRFRAPRSEPHWLAILNYIQTCSVVFRRKWMPSFDEEFLSLKLGDWPLFALLSERGSIEYLDRTMAHYRVHAGNSWNNRAADYKLRAMEGMAQYLLPRVSDETKPLWRDMLVALALKDLFLAIRTLSPPKISDRLNFFFAQSARLGKPFWLFTRLWPYYKAHYLSV
ncbi:MAG TPA: glycosyltransferase [Candidatus Dormibacteraeota bacterium]|nr:glycosyltransferase [Candidatus Dormibacteraeota bacterium]